VRLVELLGCRVTLLVTLFAFYEDLLAVRSARVLSRVGWYHRNCACRTRFRDISDVLPSGVYIFVVQSVML
jgi:hypothetical protein